MAGLDFYGYRQFGRMIRQPSKNLIRVNIESAWVRMTDIAFIFSCTDMHDMDCETFLTSRANMIHNQGQEYYDNLVGDLTCTAEQAKEILKIL